MSILSNTRSLSRDVRRLSGLMLLTACSALRLGAAPLLEESFGTVGALPAGWNPVYSGDTGTNNFTVPDIVSLGADGNYLRLNRPGTPSVSAGILYTEETFQDVSGSVIVRFAGDQLNRASVVLRAQTNAYQPAGYGITVRNSSTEEFFQFGIMNTTQTGSGNADDIGGWVNLDRANFATNTDYEIRFSAIGDQISGSIWTTGATPTMLGSQTITDSTIGGAGYVGLRHSSGNSNATIYYKDLVVIPEPGTLLLMGLSGGALLLSKVFRK